MSSSRGSRHREPGLPALRRCHGLAVGASCSASPSTSVLSASPLIAVGDFTSTVYALFFLFLRPEAISGVLDRDAAWTARSAIVRDARRRPEMTAYSPLLSSASVATCLLPRHGSPCTSCSSCISCHAHGHGLDVREGAGSPIGRSDLFTCRSSPCGGLGIQSLPRTEHDRRLHHVLQPSHGVSRTQSRLHAGIRMTDWQEDMVTLQVVERPELQAVPTSNMALPLVALRRMAMGKPDWR